MNELSRQISQMVKDAAGATVVTGMATGTNTVALDGAATAVTLPALDTVVAGQFCAVLAYGDGGKLILGPIGGVTSWTPALSAETTPPTLGTGSITSGSFSTSGGYVIGNARVAFGSSGVSAGSGPYNVSLPTEARHGGTTGQYADNTAGSVVGYWNALDSSAPATAFGQLRLINTSGLCRMVQTSFSLVGAATPWTWAASDVISYQFTYIPS